MPEKSLSYGKGVSKIRPEWPICTIESEQKEKNAALRRKTAGVTLCSVSSQIYEKIEFSFRH